MTAKFILYIEDDEGIAKLVRMHLEKYGYIVEVADSAEVGLKAFDRSVHVAVLLDYMLPGMSGIDALKKLAPNKYNPPVIVLTAAGSEKVAVEAMNLGAAEYVIKSSGTDFLNLLAIAIESALAKCSLYQENEELREKNSFYTKEILRLKDEVKKRGAQDTMLAKMIERIDTEN